MKTIREVTQLTGITRRALQEYDTAKDRDGNDAVYAIHPTQKTKGGKWLYDDNTISKLIQMQILRDAGFSRKEAAEVWEKSPDELLKALNHAIESLSEKKDRIEEQLSYVKNMKDRVSYLQSLPEDAKKMFYDLGSSISKTQLIEMRISGVMNQKAYTNNLSEFNITREVKEQLEYYDLRFGINLVLLLLDSSRRGAQSEFKSDYADNVVSYVQQYLSTLFNNMNIDGIDIKELSSEIDLDEGIHEIIKELISPDSLNVIIKELSDYLKLNIDTDVEWIAGTLLTSLNKSVNYQADKTASITSNIKEDQECR